MILGVGSPGYDKWLAEIRAKRASKINPDAYTRPTKFNHAQPKPVAKPKPYKHFIRKVGKNAKIKDQPVSEKSENS